METRETRLDKALTLLTLAQQTSDRVEAQRYIMLARTLYPVSKETITRILCEVSPRDTRNAAQYRRLVTPVTPRNRKRIASGERSWDNRR